jgi:hypothetical protein
VDKVALGQVFSKYFGFLFQFSFHRLLHTHHLSSGTGTIGRLVAVVLGGLILVQFQETGKKLQYVTVPPSHNAAANTTSLLLALVLLTRGPETPPVPLCKVQLLLRNLPSYGGKVFCFSPYCFMGHAVSYLVKALCCKWKVAGSIPDEVIGFFS